MLGLHRLYTLFLATVALGVAAATTESSDVQQRPPVVQRPALTVPTLIQIRDILAQLEAPIISTLTERFNLATPSSLYANNGSELLAYLVPRELIAAASGRYDYGKLEYPYTLPPVSPDVTTRTNSFAPGRFHQDTFTGNKELFDFYVNHLVPLFSSQSSVFFHLDNSTTNHDATFNLDATLLELISHRSHIGKVVAESKFASNVTGFTSLIKSKDATTIRALLTNTTQETGVMAQAATAATAFSNAWTTSGAAETISFVGSLQNVTSKLFRELIDVTTDIEVQYILARLN
ncbi:unnamed protein product [Somion occarium]|uniref:chorismate mutase n=1 Tax=Somion occarium TaxID=3059160 RepID=A0ABP1E801_9APHY